MSIESQECGCEVGLTREELGTWRKEHKRIMKALFDDNGEKGLVVMFRDWVQAEKTREETRERIQKEQHSQNLDRNDKTNQKLVIFGTIIGFFSLICAICMVLIAIKALHSATFDPTKIFTSGNLNPVYAELRNKTLAY